ncbi:type VI secretion system tube protein Hcp [Roseomonas sp. CECT 9278]|uniref:type VI secretion system tube protein Hcp n=1 Tax=Roseomonas sp. CECT 9278 TaxID=2845823 RepID=UPI001E3E5E24|nr:type VI secretion system tube protein Hcp [Roseomonas sp. CECT 9278]CAH0300578.1 hypothetical protein ROS9278_04537 [Roseomonas sp. CECT 9278]
MAKSDIFLSFEGVTGEHTLPSASVRPGPGNGWAQLSGCKFHADANAQSRAISKSGSSRVDFGGEAPPIEITKRTDASTLGLMRELLVGRTLRQAVVAFVRTDTDGPAEFLRYEIDRCLVVGFEFEGVDDRAIEKFQLHYEKMTIVTYSGGSGGGGAQSSATLQNGI